MAATARVVAATAAPMALALVASALASSGAFKVIFILGEVGSPRAVTSSHFLLVQPAATLKYGVAPVRVVTGVAH